MDVLTSTAGQLNSHLANAEILTATMEGRLVHGKSISYSPSIRSISRRKVTCVRSEQMSSPSTTQSSPFPITTFTILD